VGPPSIAITAASLKAQKKSRHRVLELPALEQMLVWSMWGPFDRGSIMAMFDFAVLVVKVLFFIWATQLVWIGSRLLERPVKRVLRSVLTSEDTSMKKAAQALRSSFWTAIKQKDRPKAVPQLISFGQSGTSACSFGDTHEADAPMPAKPRIIMAQVEDSGTAGTVPTPGAKTSSYRSASSGFAKLMTWIDEAGPRVVKSICRDE
jgi:hypothetical protein